MARLKPAPTGRPAQVITSRQNAIVREYRRLARARRSGEARLLLDGLRLVQDARRAGVRIISAAFTEQALSKAPEASRLAAELARSGARVVTVSNAVMEALSPLRAPSGIAAIVEYPPPDLDQVFAVSPSLVLIGVDIQDPGNVGALLRAAEAGGATGVILSGASADPFSWKGLRGSMGSAFRLPVVTGFSVAAAIDAAHHHSLAVLAARPRGGRAPFELDLTRPTAFVLGGEGAGLSHEVAALADEAVTIPMREQVESLNVAVASALLVYESLRQRSDAVSAGVSKATVTHRPSDLRLR